MSAEGIALLVLKVVAVAVELGVFLWIAVYTYLAKWWRNPVGRTVVDFAFRIAVAVVPLVLSLFFHFSRASSTVAAWTDAVLWAWVAEGMFHRIPLWVRLHLDRTGNQVYTGMGPFLADVVRRHGRPIWKDWEAGNSPDPRAGEPHGDAS